RVREAKSLPIDPRLIVASPERVRHEDNREVLRLAPSKSIPGAGDETAHRVERKRARRPKVVHRDIVKADPAVGEPLLDPAVRLLAQRIGLDRSEEHTSELQSRGHLVCRLLLEKKKESCCRRIPRGRARSTVRHLTG